MRKVIKQTNQPVKLPIEGTVIFYLFLDHLKVSGIIWGIYITLFSIVWIMALISMWNQEQIDIFSQRPKLQTKSRFRERLDELEEQEKN